MNWIKKRVLDGKLLCGTFLSLGAGCVAEMAGRAGLDWVLIDTEHGLVDYNALVTYLQAARIGGAAPVVRVIANSGEHFKRALDLGASGIMVPQVNNADEATLAVRYMKYPPDGIRGLTRTNWASSFGFDSKEYMEQANDNLLLMIQIETREAVKNIDAIAAVSGVDVLFIGPSDLSCSLGIPCDLNHPQMKKCIDAVTTAAKKYGKHTGILIKNAEQLKQIVESGFTLIAVETDMTIVKAGLTKIADTFKAYKQA